MEKKNPREKLIKDLAWEAVQVANEGSCKRHNVKKMQEIVQRLRRLDRKS